MKLICRICKKEYEWEPPKMCCDWSDCWCGWLPNDPLVCSDECFDKLNNS